MKYSCCIELLFQEYEFSERIYRAKEAGFEFVEFFDWENKDLPGIEKALAKTGMKVAAMKGNTRGRMVDKKDSALYVEGVLASIPAARRLGVTRLLLLSDIMQANGHALEAPYIISEAEKREASISALKALCPVAEQNDITLLIEPLNTRVDHIGYSLNRSREAYEIVKKIDNSRVRMVFDAYHMQIMEGNLIATIRDEIDAIGYFHIADVPGRGQPGTGELNFQNILKQLLSAGYEGIVGFEFEPRGVSSLEAVRETFRIIGQNRS